MPDSPEDAAVTKDDDGEGDEEDEGEEQHCVRTHGGREGHVVPGARGHQSLGDVGACSRSSWDKVSGVGPPTFLLSLLPLLFSVSGLMRVEAELQFHTFASSEIPLVGLNFPHQQSPCLPSDLRAKD